METIIRLFEKVKATVRSWFWPTPAITHPIERIEPPAQADPPKPVEAAPQEEAQPSAKRREADVAPPEAEDERTFGAYYNFDNVLESLDSYFKYISYLKHDDRDTYDLYKHVGGQIISPKALVAEASLPPGWLQQRPSFGLVHFGIEDTEDKVHAKMMYYQKFKGYADLQPFAGDIYRVVLYYVVANDTKIRQPVVFFVHISDVGKISLIKQRVSEQIRIKHKRKKRGFDEFSTAYRETWRVPELLLDIIKENRNHLEAGGAKTVNDAAARIFSIIASTCYNSTDGVRVNVYRKGVACVFNVAMSRTAYFFRDREKTVTKNGTTKRIFHATRAHFRNYADGRIVPVRMHFKGEREFTWNGYNVIITVSGLHHKDLNDFSVAAVDIDQTNDIKAMIGMNKTGKIIADAIKRKPEVAKHA